MLQFIPARKLTTLLGTIRGEFLTMEDGQLKYRPIQDKLIRLTRELQHIPKGKSRHFSFIVRRNRIISLGWNSLKTHTKAIKYGYTYGTVHSELDAIKKLSGSVEGLDFYNTRIDRNGRICIAKPCCYCQEMLRKIGVKRVFYTNDGWHIHNL